jgi:shikimate kinase
MKATKNETPGIYLVGFMGSGKTTIGRKLAADLRWPFADLDDDIEAHAHKTIPELFDQDGETEFRRIESEMLARRVASVKQGKPLVLSLGGGAFAQQRNREALENAGLSIWLDVPLHMVERRVAGFAHRPLARDPLKFRDLFYARRNSYAKADVHIEVSSDDPRPAVDAILALEFFR